MKKKIMFLIILCLLFTVGCGKKNTSDVNGEDLKNVTDEERERNISFDQKLMCSYTSEDDSSVMTQTSISYYKNDQIVYYVSTSTDTLINSNLTEEEKQANYEKVKDQMDKFNTHEGMKSVVERNGNTVSYIAEIDLTKATDDALADIGSKKLRSRTVETSMRNNESIGATCTLENK